MSRSVDPDGADLDPSDLPAPTCDFCGFLITERGQECVAFDPGERRCQP